MRKILYSPGYGAGWTTWHGGTKEQKQFMLEYRPFVEYLEAGGDPYALEPEHDSPEETWHPLTREFAADWQRHFPTEALPYLGGLDGLTVMTIEDDDVVFIDEYDGSESVTVRGKEDHEWL